MEKKYYLRRSDWKQTHLEGKRQEKIGRVIDIITMIIGLGAIAIGTFIIKGTL